MSESKPPDFRGFVPEPERNVLSNAARWRRVLFVVPVGFVVLAVVGLLPVNAQRAADANAFWAADAQRASCDELYALRNRYKRAATHGEERETALKAMNRRLQRLRCGARGSGHVRQDVEPDDYLTCAWNCDDADPTQATTRWERCIDQCIARFSH